MSRIEDELIQPSYQQASITRPLETEHSLTTQNPDFLLEHYDEQDQDELVQPSYQQVPEQAFDLDNPFLTPSSDYPPDLSYQQDIDLQSESFDQLTPSKQAFDLDNPFLTPGSDYSPDLSYQQDQDLQTEPLEPAYS